MNFPLEFFIGEYKNKGEKAIFEEKNFKRHAKKHQELLNPSYIENFVKLTIESPDVIYKSLNNERCHCYYKCHNFNDDREGRWIRFTKIIILIKKIPPHIIESAFTESALSHKAIREINFLWRKQNSKI